MAKCSPDIGADMGVPAPVIKNRIGEAFRNNLNCHFTLIGHFGHNLTTVAGIEGGRNSAELQRHHLLDHIS